MKTLSKELKNLKKLNDFTDKDLIASKVSDSVLEDFEKFKNHEPVSKRETKKETIEFLKEEIARAVALKKHYGSTQDWVKTIKTSEDKMALVVLVSDWHVGKNTKDKKGKTTYSSEIATKMLSETYLQKISQYILDHNLIKRIDEVVLCLMGDLVENEIIYETQVHHIDMPVGLQKVAAVKSVVQFVDGLEQFFKAHGVKQIAVKIKGIKGNHGRVQRGQLEASSWDVLIYHELDFLFGYAGRTNITVEFTYDDEFLFTVKGKTGMLRHHAPAATENPGGRNKYGGWYELWNYDFLCHGHYHHWGMNTYNGRMILRNGSFVGSDDLSNNMGVRDRRCQMIFGVTKDEVPAFIHRVVLD